MALQTPLQPGERLVKESGANLQRGIESVGGIASSPIGGLIFESHKFNVQSGATEIPLSDVADMRKVWTKSLGAIPIATNSIAQTTAGGQEHRIVCNKRDAWIEAVRSQAAAPA